MKLWFERGFSRLPIAQRIKMMCPDLEIYTDPVQTPPGCFPLAVPQERNAIERIAEIVKEHKIDIFWPQKSAMLDLSGVGCQIHLAAGRDILKLVDDKDAFVQWMKDDPKRPEQQKVEGVDEIEAVVRARQEEGRKTCIKPVKGVNGNGFWYFQDNYGSWLDDPEKRQIDFDTWLFAARRREQVKGKSKMLVMDFMPGPELSLDILCWDGIPLTHAVRTKIDANHQRVQNDHPIADHARSIAERLGLHGIVSLQYRLDDNDNWRMLEVNPRPAGGSIYSEDAGFQIITDWVRLLTGKAKAKEIEQIEGDLILRLNRVALPV